MRVQLAAAVLVILHASSASPRVNLLFETFKHDFQRSYSSEEEPKRLEAFASNLQRIDKLNSKPGRTYTAGITRFSDLTTGEFKALYTMQSVPTSSALGDIKEAGTLLEPLEDLPTAVDWRQHNAVTAVKNQGPCGSCWVFAAVGAMEGADAISRGGNATSLSEEQYMACYGKGNREVCNGGEIQQAYIYAENASICTEAAYPYIAPSGHPYPPPPKLTCEASKCDAAGAVGIAKGRVHSYVAVKPQSEEALMAAVAKQPVAVSIDAGGLNSYQKGVLSGACQTGYVGDHAVLVVGYGTTSGGKVNSTAFALQPQGRSEDEDTEAEQWTEPAGLDYWVVKNSYGLQFGEAGYFRLLRNDPKCDKRGGLGLLASPVYPVVV